ncbi:GDSL esterase/lipase [Cinnamomum micranthum f. kanehirae]|uniref:GDSL esterase/lipase n=1 Tax=Cinnamomum micranthum f. kanehirae TaxID=337451 RepID=A0A3S3NYF8_9MAGN|nr:GDSL esterase/lipase [Cinnamomum micranthum f. kanehirae]
MCKRGLLLLVLNLLGMVVAEPQVPCLFIFGDSLSDNGNNNNLATLAKSNYQPYGIDFPDGPTGRFCNGRTAVDFIAQFLGFDHFIPPFANITGRDILSGVNYASGGSGIRDETGANLGQHISLSMQVVNFHATVEQLKIVLGSKTSVADYLSKCLYSVNIGVNDYANNYFIPEYYSTSRLYTPEQFATVLIQQYSEQLKIMYNYGARKVALMGLFQYGCVPLDLAQNNGACNSTVNSAIDLFNAKLPSLVDDLNKILDGAKFTFVNNTAISNDIGMNGQAYGFTVANAACCSVLTGVETCRIHGSTCQNRSEYVFWDQAHPTEAFHLINAKGMYNSSSSSSYTYPVNIQQLAQL